jgi:hypothetical protein
LGSIRTPIIFGLILRHELLPPPPPIFNEATCYTNWSVLPTWMDTFLTKKSDVASVQISTRNTPDPESSTSGFGKSSEYFDGKIN